MQSSINISWIIRLMLQREREDRSRTVDLTMCCYSFTVRSLLIILSKDGPNTAPSLQVRTSIIRSICVTFGALKTSTLGRLRYRRVDTADSTQRSPQREKVFSDCRRTGVWERDSVVTIDLSGWQRCLRAFDAGGPFWSRSFNWYIAGVFMCISGCIEAFVYDRT